MYDWAHILEFHKPVPKSVFVACSLRALTMRALKLRFLCSEILFYSGAHGAESNNVIPWSLRTRRPFLHANSFPTTYRNSFTLWLSVDTSFSNVHKHFETHSFAWWRKPCDTCCNSHWNTQYFVSRSDFADTDPLTTAWIKSQTTCDQSNCWVKGFRCALPITHSSHKPCDSAILILISNHSRIFHTWCFSWWPRRSCQSWRVSEASAMLTSAGSLGITMCMSMAYASCCHKLTFV